MTTSDTAKQKSGLRFIPNCPIKKLIPYPRNPRHNDQAVDAVSKSIESYGFISPIITNEKYEICAGHTRYKAAMQNGLMTVPIIIAPQLIGDRFKGFNIADNQTGSLAAWDDDELIAIVAELRASDFDLSSLGFDDSELSELLTAGGVDEGLTAPDDLPDPPKTTITKPGDIWILGEHRLLCGNSTSEKDIGHLMDGKKASLLATDPPYCVEYTGKDRPHGGRDWSEVYREVEITDASKFITDFYTVCLKFLNPNTALYLWHASARRAEIEAVCKSLNILIHQQIIWVKPCVIPTYSMYMWRHEPCLLMWIKGQKPLYRLKRKVVSSVWPIDFLRSGNPLIEETHSDVWELDWEGKRRGNTIAEHPTVKPVEVFGIPMRVHTLIGEICLEPFCGSGSQIIAAERLRRRCFAMELEPFFVDVAVERWQNFTGQKARRVKSGK